MDKKNLTIIDVTSLIYSACYNCSIKEDTSDDFGTYKEAFDYYISSILEDTKANYYILFGDSNTSYRKKLFKSFKADRPKPHIKFKSDLTKHAKDVWNMFIHNELEADDLCLITKNKYKDIYNVTIAAIDSDLQQEEGTFFNYSWRRPLYKKFGDAIPNDIKEKAFKNAFIVVTNYQAIFNLWIQVLIKGHNNKTDYLEGCGQETAINYFKSLMISPYKDATLNAFIYGININREENIKRSVKGYGLNLGIDKFQKAFKQTYLFRNMEELTNLGIELILPKVVEVPDF